MTADRSDQPGPLVELNGVRITALGVVADGFAPARRLVCGTLARPWRGDHEPRPRGGPELPDRVAVPGRPGVLVPWTGWFTLLDGEVVAVFGAVVEPIGGAESARDDEAEL